MLGNKVTIKECAMLVVVLLSSMVQLLIAALTSAHVLYKQLFSNNVRSVVPRLTGVQSLLSTTISRSSGVVHTSISALKHTPFESLMQPGDITFSQSVLGQLFGYNELTFHLFVCLFFVLFVWYCKIKYLGFMVDFTSYKYKYKHSTNIPQKKDIT